MSRPELLGKQPTADDNGLLQASEILEQVRLGADRVVLSACDTGLGEELTGKGLIGLTRAFQYAGAKSVVASMWGANDASTAVLMKAFYQGYTMVQARMWRCRRRWQPSEPTPGGGIRSTGAPFTLVGSWN